DDVIGGKGWRVIACHAAAARVRDSAPDDEIHHWLQNHADHPDEHGDAVLKLDGELGLKLHPVDGGVVVQEAHGLAASSMGPVSVGSVSTCPASSCPAAPAACGLAG